MSKRETRGKGGTYLPFDGNDDRAHKTWARFQSKLERSMLFYIIFIASMVIILISVFLYAGLYANGTVDKIKPTSTSYKHQSTANVRRVVLEETFPETGNHVEDSGEYDEYMYQFSEKLSIQEGHTHYKFVHPKTGALVGLETTNIQNYELCCALLFPTKDDGRSTIRYCNNGNDMQCYLSKEKRLVIHVDTTSLPENMDNNNINVDATCMFRWRMGRTHPKMQRVEMSSH